MLGIPFVIRRFSDAGVEDVTVFLRTRRSGQAGDKMRKHLRAYHAAVFAQTKAAGKAGSLMRRALSGETQPGEAELEKIEAEQSAAMDSAQKESETALEEAQEVCLCALKDNYGEKEEELVDGLTDHELHGLVSTIEMGAMPRDFFPSPGIPPKSSSMEPSGSGPAKSS
jgi:hypothetical protein